MSELDNLRPEVREALNRISRNFHISADTNTIRTELLQLTDENARLLAANRDAMDHFEQMKAELAALTKKCTCSRRSVSSPFGCRVCNPQLEIADLESKLATSEAELAALRARIADAPTREVFKYSEPKDIGEDVRHLIGKRVRLVVEE